MGLFSSVSKYEKNVTRSDAFLKQYAIKAGQLKKYVEKDGVAYKELVLLENAFQHTAASPESKAKKVEKKIAKAFKRLLQELESGKFDENQISHESQNIRTDIGEIASLR